MHTSATALILEGTKPVADKVAQLLDHLGYDLVCVTPRGEDALACCRQQPPDLLVVGGDLTGLIDEQVTQKMIRDTSNIPTVQLTDQPRSGEATMPRLGSATDLAASIAHAFGVVAWNKSAGPPQDYILPDRILLRHEERMVSIRIEDIRYVTDYLNYSQLQLAGRHYFITISLPLVEHQLMRHGFLRVHRDYLVNRRCIHTARYEQLTLDNNEVIPIGRPYRRRVSRQVKELA